jgi:hypothetical protein
VRYKNEEDNRSITRYPTHLQANKFGVRIIGIIERWESPSGDNKHLRGVSGRNWVFTYTDGL